MIIVDKDFGSQALKDELRDAILGWDGKFQWVFAPASNKEEDEYAIRDDDKMYEHLMFVSVVGPGHPYRLKIVGLMESMLRKHNITYSEIMRIKINIVPMASQDSEGMYQMPHIDNKDDHKVFLYYVNDADGDTYLFNEKLGDSFQELTVNQKVAPEEGKAILFDGHIYHAPSAPLKSPFRCVINIDFN